MNKRLDSMKKILLIFVAFFGLGMGALMAQTGNVGVNTGTPAVTLDVKKATAADHMAGIIAPYVTGDDLAGKTYLEVHDGAIVYVTAAAAAANQVNSKQTEYVSAKGYYYYDNSVGATPTGRWIRLVKGDPVKDNKVNWFYMPSIAIPTSSVATAQTVDLFAKYKEQFDAPKVVSSDAPADIPFFGAATDLYYYVTDYDIAVLENISIDANGKMTYDVKATPTDCSFINIVFVIK